MVIIAVDPHDHTNTQDEHMRSYDHRQLWSITSCVGSTASLEDGLGALPELEVLELRCCPRVAGGGLAALAGHTRLRRVVLQECGGATAGGLLRGLLPLTQLQVHFSTLLTPPPQVRLPVKLTGRTA